MQSKLLDRLYFDAQPLASQTNKILFFISVFADQKLEYIRKHSKKVVLKKLDAVSVWKQNFGSIFVQI